MEMCPNQMISTLILLHVMVNRVSQCVDIRIFLVKGESRDGERGEDEENVLYRPHMPYTTEKKIELTSKKENIHLKIYIYCRLYFNTINVVFRI